ncbi:MAG: hypothetical protein ACE5EY_08885 [Anaerolineae bacterium]
MLPSQTSLAYIPESIDQNLISKTTQPADAALTMPSLTAASLPNMPSSPLSIAGSDIATDQCYLADATQTVCFQIYNSSTTGEWITDVRLTFPTPIGNWVVNCLPGGQDATDSVGYPVNFSCSPTLPNEIEYIDNDSDGFGEITSGASWNTCVDLTIPAGYTGNRLINWNLNGDDGGNATGTIQMEQCTPLTLTPSRVNIEGCNNISQTLEFKLVNYAAGTADVDFTYDTADAIFTGLTNLQIVEGETVTFTTQLQPNLCLDPGEQINATLTARAQGSGHSDSAAITQTITQNSGWHRLADSPKPSMDNAVIWANQGDGGLWSIGGYGSGGAAQRYNPTNGNWITYTNPLTPVIEYPMDGCYGLNGGDEIVVLFPDTIITGSLQIFNITHKSWYTETTPAGYPAEGRWGHDIVSMLQHTGENVCYLSGGSTEEGGGRTKDLWRYQPETNTANYLGAFPASIWFGFHASWYVPWIGNAGGICVAGGVDHNHQINDSTQCYDIQGNTFNTLNSDLGALPEPWWGMADGWAVHDGAYQIWLANGVAQDGTLLPVSAYLQEGMANFAGGPEIPVGMYRLEGSAWNNQFYTLNGSRGGFGYSEFTLNLGPCPICNELFLPVTVRP